MAKKKKEEVVEEITEPKQEQPVAEEQKVEETSNPNEIKDDGTIKVNLDKWAKVSKKEEADVAKVDLSEKKEEEPKEEVKEEPVEEVKEEEKTEEVVEETPVVEEITEIEVEEKVEEVKEAVEEAVAEAKETGEPLPENIQKVVEFINETGGSLEDYVKINQDYDKFEDNELVNEYLKQTKPHLTDEERVFVMEDLYSFNEEVDDPKDIRRKKLALKEQVANAKSHLDGQKSKYYAEVKAGSRLAPEQQKAVDFFNRYNEDAKAIEKNKSVFEKRTNDVFNNEFKGFEYNVGEKRFRLNIKEADKVKDNQMNINNFVSKFTNKQTQEVDDAKGYHKSLFTAMNPDLVANHFYQQGKADAIKDSMAKAKNVDMSANSTHPDVVESGGMKVRAISGNSSNDFKVKIGRNPNKIS
ncbi:MAG: hypothetical protein CBC24_02945 [Candidatus Pelagibacter sp. TMED64]|nr:MAG: hypothetical protein CBC24_02945 [Candidatus Pelagibacter sp. TMED64]